MSRRSEAMVALPKASTDASSAAASERLLPALKDAGLAAVITLGLCIPVVTLRTEAGDGGKLILLPRVGLTVIMCLAVFLARLGYLTVWGKEARAARQPKTRGEAVKTVAAPRFTLSSVGLR